MKGNVTILSSQKRKPKYKNLGDVSKISNLTGYSKVGYHRDLALRGGLYLVSTLGDYYNLANMSQTGDSVSIPDGDFEKLINMTQLMMIQFMVIHHGLQ